MSQPTEFESQWTTEGFNAYFETLIKKDRELQYWKAYEMAEQEHIRLFGKIRFNSYQSFRNCRHNILFGQK